MLAPIPELPKNIDPKLRSFLVGVKMMLEVNSGRRGDPLDEMVTKRDLIASGIAQLATPRGTDLAPTLVTPVGINIIPPRPLSFTATPGFGGISLQWENAFTEYSVHAYTEVWRSETPDAADRIFLDSSRGVNYFDRINEYDAKTYYYWVRFVSEFNKYGAFSVMVAATKQQDVREIMDRISGEISESDLALAFQDKVADIGNSYVIKLDPTGAYAAGWGLYNTGTTSEFSIQADRFSIGKPGSGRARPFIVDNGMVYIDTALIREASIQQGQIGAISFGKITDKNGNAVTNVSGLMRVDMLDVANLRITDGNVYGVLKSGALASNGQPRWMLDKSGGMTLNGSGVGGRMEIRDSVIKVFDANGVLRVQLGDLSL